MESKFCNLRGDPQRPPPTEIGHRVPTAEEVLADVHTAWDMERLTFRDPDKFLAGQLCLNYRSWGPLLQGEDEVVQLVRKILKEGVDVQDFFQPFDGNFKGRHYRSDRPLGRIFQTQRV